MQEEVAGIAVNNPRVVEEYRKRQQEIQKLADELQSLNATLEAAREEMESLKVTESHCCLCVGDEGRGYMT